MILIVGPGRCGTSTVARWCGEAGVFMGERFRPADEHNPKGYWEDLDFKDANQALLSNEASFPVWLETVRALSEQRREPWGLKDPRLCYLIREYLCLFDPLVIRLHRDKHDVADSMAKCYGWFDALQIVEQREAALNASLGDVIDIDFSAVVDGSAKQQVRELCQTLHLS